MLNILYRDEWFVAVDKPAGMLVHRTKMAAGERVFAMQTLRDQIGQHVYPVHRLDKGTSGVLLFALDPDSARLISDQFQARSVEKTYQAVVRGWPSKPGLIDYPLKERLDKTTDGKARTDKPAQEAQTEFRILTRTEISQAVGRYATTRWSFVEIRPRTGRKHQIRRHFKHIFHPIIGDRKYGDRDHNMYVRTSLGVDRMMLAATGLRFTHPVSGLSVSISIETPFPAAIMQALKKGESLR